jgi:hypothetical protein
VNQRFAILNPCPKTWADLQGEGRSRYCGVCKTHVHAVAEYSPKEWTKLWQQSNGMVCGFLASETVTTPRSRRAILLGALLTAAAPLWAQIGRVRIRVTDPTGAVITAAEASLLGPNNKSILTLSANDNGEILWTDLPLGESRFEVHVPGFKLHQMTAIIRNGDEQKIEARLEVGTTGTVVYVDPVQIQTPQALDPTSGAVTTRELQPKPAKRRWWQIFR